MGDPEANKNFPDQAQRAAVCYSRWGEKKANAAHVYEVGDDEFIFEAFAEVAETDSERLSWLERNRVNITVHAHQTPNNDQQEFKYVLYHSPAMGNAVIGTGSSIREAIDDGMKRL